MSKIFDVKGKVMVITGGGGILGRSMSEYMCEQGVKLAIVDRCREAGQKLEADLLAKGYTAKSFCADVLERESLEIASQEIVAEFGSIDILVNAAGGNMAGATIPPDKTIFDLDMDAFKKVVDLNLFGTVLPTMIFA
jgi:NAD(P)-dependent dehydrogenase (short-subunit alcohol dehydrogenase family)